MVSFILFGMNGWQHVDAGNLSPIEDGVLGTGGNEIFVTTRLQADLFARGLSVGRPGWENRLNDLVTDFVTKGSSSTAIAQDLFAQLGQEELRAMKSNDPGLIAQQRVREAALAFNLLATGSTWKPVIASGFPYRTRDWVGWCDDYIGKMQAGARGIRPINFVAARLYERAADDLVMVRNAFVSSGVMSI